MTVLRLRQNDDTRRARSRADTPARHSLHTSHGKTKAHTQPRQEARATAHTARIHAGEAERLCAHRPPSRTTLTHARPHGAANAAPRRTRPLAPARPTRRAAACAPRAVRPSPPRAV